MTVEEPAGRWLGVATAGYAVEGGFNGPGEPANHWVQWEQNGLVPSSGSGCDFWRRPEALLDRAASLGCDAFGLSVEWARIEPEDGCVDVAVLDRYAEILGMCAARGLAPVVTLHHGMHPWWLGEEFWLTPGSPDLFAAHVARVVERLGDRCGRWITLHEPNLLAVAGWVVAAEPPARVGALADAWAVGDNLLTAHVLAYEAVHAVQPEAEVAVTPRASSVYELHQLWVDLLCARYLGISRDGLDRWLDGRRAAHDRAVPAAGAAEAVLRTAAAATSPFGEAAPAGPCRPGRPGGLGRFLRRPSPRRAVDALYAGPHRLPMDAVAVSWQQPVPTRLVRVPAGRPVGRGPAAPWLRQPWDVPPDPEGLVGWCRRQALDAPGLPLWVVDGGLATPRGSGARRDGWDRVRYLRAQLDAVREGGVAGYLYRSIADGYEPDGARYGLYRAESTPDGTRWADDGGAAASLRALLVDLRR